MEVDLDALVRGDHDSFAQPVVDHGRNLLAAIAPDLKRARPLAHPFYWRLPRRYTREIVQYSRIAGEPWQDVLLANVSYDLVLNFGCSTAALATSRGPVLARNLDWEPAAVMAKASYQLECHRPGKHQFTIAGWPASIGVVTGMSSRGFALALNAVRSIERIPILGYPVQIFLRHVLEVAADFDEAVRMISTKTLLTGGMITVVGRRNDQRVIIERTPRRAEIRRAEGDEPLVVTNNYQVMQEDRSKAKDPFLANLRETSCGRFERLSECVRGIGGGEDPADSQLLFYLYDPRVRQSSTVHQVIARPAEGANGSFAMYVPRSMV